MPVVQLVERQIVVLVVEGSSPFGHPIKKEDDFFSHPPFFVFIRAVARICYEELISGSCPLSTFLFRFQQARLSGCGFSLSSVGKALTVPFGRLRTGA